jgi:hypothetical protein
MKLTTHRRQVPRLRMNGATRLRHLYASMVWTGTTHLFIVSLMHGLYQYTFHLHPAVSLSYDICEAQNRYDGFRTCDVTGPNKLVFC